MATAKYITVDYTGGGRAVVGHATKRAAVAYGTALRLAGRDVYVHSTADARKFGVI